MKSRSTLLIAMLILIQGSVLWAANIAYMPGDACFPVRLSKETAERLANAKTDFELNFELPPEVGYAFCGWAGYMKLTIQDVPPIWSEKIREVYTALRHRYPRNVRQFYDEQGNVEELETNSFILLIYNRSFDLDHHRIGLRYNENWMDPLPDVEDTEPAKVAKLYQPYLSLPQAVSEDWKESTKVEGLKVNFPKLNDGPAEVFRQYGVVQPMTAAAKDVRILILPEQELEAYFRKEDCRFIAFDVEGVWQYEFKKNGKMTSTPWSRKLEINDGSEP